MDKQESLDHLSDEVLTKSYKTAKGILIGFIVVFVLLAVAAVFITIRKGFGVFSVLPIIFVSILMSNIANFSKLKTEMKRRNLPI